MWQGLESGHCWTGRAKERGERGGQNRRSGPITQGCVVARDSEDSGCIPSAEGDHRKALSRKVTSLFLTILF